MTHSFHRGKEERQIVMRDQNRRQHFPALILKEAIAEVFAEWLEAHSIEIIDAIAKQKSRQHD